jgi:xanthine dehydrogenase accessory factor
MTILQTIAELERRGEPVALATIVRSQGSVPRHDGSKMLIYPDGHIDGTIGGGDMESRVIKEALASLKDGATRILSYAFRDVQKGDVGVCGGEVEVFVEPLLPKPQVIIAGGGHVGKAVAHLASWLGFHVIVTDDRPEYATPEAVPSADEHIVCALSELPTRTPIGANSYVLLTTRGMPVDIEGLPALLETSAAYIGVIGSRRRWEVCCEKLRANGMSDDDIARITSPIGIELNAESPEEIAVSIMAELIMLRRKGTGERMQSPPSPR